MSQMNVVGKIVKKYYKTVPAVTQAFVQPTLSANGVMGGNAFAVSCDSVYGNFQPWYAFRNTYVAREYFHSGQGQPHWLAFYNPNPLKVSSLGIQNRGIDGSCLVNYEIHASEDGADWITITTGTMPNTALGAENIVSISNQNYYKYWRIKSLSCTGGYNDYWACSRVTITATEMTQAEYEIEVGASEEYDRYEDIIVPYALTKIVRKYYKTVPAVTQSTTQPVLTENGSLGGDSFGCAEEAFLTEGWGTQQRFWRLFGDSEGEEWQINEVSTSKYYWGKFYNPRPLQLLTFSIQNTQGAYAPAAIILSGSNNDSDYVEIANVSSWGNTDNGWQSVTIPSNLGFYKYFKLEVKPRISTAVMLGEIAYSANEMLEEAYEVEVSESEEYDRYEDIIQQFCEVKQNAN